MNRQLAAYLRVSTDDQHLGLTAQRTRITAWATAHEVTITDWFIDEGVSGAVHPHERPAFARLLRALEPTPEDALYTDGTPRPEGLVVVKLDRLSRRTKHMLELAEEMAGEGWTLACVHEQLDTATATGRFFLTLLAAMAEWERETIGERTKAALGAKRARGERWCNEAPYGWEWTADGGLRESRFEQAILGLIDTWRERDQISPQRIAEALNVRGNRMRSGKRWTRQRVWELLPERRKRPQ